MSAFLRDSQIFSHSNSSSKYKKMLRKTPVHLELSTDLEWKQDRYGFSGKFSTRVSKNEPFKDLQRPSTSTNVNTSKSKHFVNPSLAFEKPDQFIHSLKQESSKTQPTILLNSRLNTEVVFPHRQNISNAKPSQTSLKEPSRELKSFMEMKKISSTGTDTRETPKSSVFINYSKDKVSTSKNRSMNSSKLDLKKNIVGPPVRVESAVLKKKSLPSNGELPIFMPKKHSITSTNKLLQTNHLKDFKEPKEDIFEQIRKVQKLNQISEGILLLSPEEKHQNLLAKARVHLNKKKEQVSTSSNLFKPMMPASRTTPFRQYQH